MRGSPTLNLNLFINMCLFIISVWLPEGVVAQPRNTTAAFIPVKVGVVLDMDSLVGKIGLSCMNMALSDFYATHPHYKTRLVFHTKDSMDDVFTAAATALDLIKNVQVQAIIGPRSSMQANFVISLGNKSQVPIISFSTTSPSLTSAQSPYFFRAAQSGSFQVKAISSVVEAFGWREAVPIYVDNQFGETLIPSLTDALQEINTRVPYLCVVSELETDDGIVEELYKLKSMQTRVFILHTPVSLGSRILAKAEENEMMSEGYVWIMTQTMTNLWTSIDSSAINSLQGVLGVRSYVPKTEKLENFTAHWKRKFLADNPNDTDVVMNMFGLWAYDATIALAMAVEKAGTQNLRFNKANISKGGVLTELETLSVSQNGPRLIQELSNITFTGLSGDFHFVDGQLESNVYQIVNINGNGERRVGFWTPQSGLVKDLNSSKTSTNSTSNPKLGPIIWPGDTTSVPKGWKIPTGAKKLKFGVPVNSFKEFVDVKWDPNSNKPKSIQGYCIDIFDAVMDSMPYPVPYRYVPFETPERDTTGYYSDLVDQVIYGNYDAVVGDITITANRSLFVDFTLPYTQSGVAMLVPIRDIKKKDAWVFLKPLTRDLWVMSGCFFVFIGFVVWILEHRVNQDFRGPPLHEVGTSFWFSFSTMMFSHRERVVSNLGRFVVIIWCFVVLILTQSYTASLTSLLTVEQLQPTVTDINMLLKLRQTVGFQTGSYVEGVLLRKGFHKSQLKNYTSLEDLHDLLSNGTSTGGISAAFDEIPYFQLLIAKYCGRYKTLETTFRTDGFGFVFPKGSHLVADVSRALLNVTQGDQMKKIENIWLKNDVPCPDLDPLASSNSLGLESFWGLFLIAGVASISAIIIFVAKFLYEQRKALVQFDPETSVWRKVGMVLRIFDQKDMSRYGYKNNEPKDSNSHCSVHSIGFEGGSPNTNCPPSPSRLSMQTDSPDFVVVVDHGTTIDSPDRSPSPKRSSFELIDCIHGG